ncbi:DNA/RNA non-specific endonuclease, partial [Peribacillus frigoritolerans]|uniref:DNA/RNA non-specific endonuclease n=1 Tax=Peribacillus frigoritolerans TaxID=450367 RepID=UPI002B24E0F7
EFTGYYDSIRASTGVDPVTGRKLSDAERIAAGAMAAAGFIPVVGWAGRAIKGGSALYKTAKGLNAANHALDAYKTTKGFSLLQKTEYGIYGLLAANGLGEAATGKDMFGNQLTEEQRQNGLLMALGIGGVAGAAKVADKVANGTKFIPYSKEFAQKHVQKVQATITDIARSGKNTLKNIGDELSKKEIPKRISVEQVSLAGGPNLPQVVMEKQTIKEAYQKFTVKDSKVEGVSGESVPKGIDNVRYGEQYTKVNRKKTLKPNVEYTTKEGYKYTTDDNGRIAIAEAKLELGKAKRNPYAQRKVGGDDRLSNDDGGHLIASIFKGSGEIDNLVPMNATLNRSEYKTLENTWKKALVEGKEVTIKVKPIYEAQSTRPSEFKINYVIDGKKYSDRLTNYLGGK